jgi:biopolymer transport protein ExbB/TolQ
VKFNLVYLSFVLLLIGGWNPSGVFAEDDAGVAVDDVGAAALDGGAADDGAADDGAADDGGAAADDGGQAEAPVASGDTDEGGMTLLDLLTAGGAVGYLILALSVIGLGLVFENFFSLRRSILMPPEIIEELERYFQEEAYEEALELGNVAPMMGLIGTVQGMIAAFDTMKRQAGAPKPAELAGDISLALVTTLLGLCVAIPMLAFHMFLKNRVVKIVLEAEAVATELMERFKAS